MKKIIKDLKTLQSNKFAPSCEVINKVLEIFQSLNIKIKNHPTIYCGDAHCITIAFENTDFDFSADGKIVEANTDDGVALLGTEFYIEYPNELKKFKEFLVTELI